MFNLYEPVWACMFVGTCSIARFPCLSCPGCYALSFVENSRGRRRRLHNHCSGRPSGVQTDTGREAAAGMKTGRTLEKAPKAKPYITSHPLLFPTKCQLQLSLSGERSVPLWGISGLVLLCLFVPHPSHLLSLSKSHKCCCTLWKIHPSFMSNQLALLKPCCHFYSLSYCGNGCSLCFAEKKQWILPRFSVYDLLIKDEVSGKT